MQIKHDNAFLYYNKEDISNIVVDVDLFPFPFIIICFVLL